MHREGVKGYLYPAHYIVTIVVVLFVLYVDQITDIAGFAKDRSLKL